MAVDTKDGVEAERAAEGLSGWAFVGTLLSWLMLLLGLRVVDTQEGVAKLLTGLGVLLLVACFGQRLWVLMEAREDRRPAARGLAIAAAVGLLGLAIYAGNSEWGRGHLGIDLPNGSQADRIGDLATVLWVSLIALSVIPTILGELARRSMLRAERVESGRVVAAMVAGAAVSLAAVYGSLFTYAATQTNTSKDYSFFRVAAPSDSTVRMVASLEEPMKVLAFFSTHSEARPKVVAYLQDLKQRAGNLDIEVHDMMLSPKLAKEHKVRRDGVIVLVREKKSETIDIGDKIARAMRKLRKLDGEFQKALIKARRSKRTVYLTVGHGEINEVNDV
ncbi:MAG: hypothetical protein VB934_18375, partial [Polyangiaceae bacterium]